MLRHSIALHCIVLQQAILIISKQWLFKDARISFHHLLINISAMRYTQLYDVSLAHFTLNHIHGDRKKATHETIFTTMVSLYSYFDKYCVSYLLIFFMYFTIYLAQHSQYVADSNQVIIPSTASSLLKKD